MSNVATRVRGNGLRSRFFAFRLPSLEEHDFAQFGKVQTALEKRLKSPRKTNR